MTLGSSSDFEPYDFLKLPSPKLKMKYILQ